MKAEGISEKHLRVQRVARTIKQIAEILSGVVAVVASVHAFPHHHMPEITALFALMIALLALSEFFLSWPHAHRAKLIVEVVAGAVAIVFVTRALIDHTAPDVVDLFLIVLAITAVCEWWLHRTYQRRKDPTT